jgi:hypothetical protein
MVTTNAPGSTASPLAAPLDRGSPCDRRPSARARGLPGVPLAIARPALKVTLLESVGKKARFLREVKRVLELDNLGVFEGRAERWTP